MKIDALLCAPETPAVAIGRRLLDYVALTKPRVSVLVLFTVAAGAFLAGGAAVEPFVVLHAVVGTALTAAGACALNQLLERGADARMRRTENRPLPAGRLQPAEVLVFGLALGIVGVLYLALTLRRPAPALLAAITFAAYVVVYTPLKSRTAWNTLVGAVPGALPPVIGWTAVVGTVDAEAAALFAFVFLWQVPHFLAIAWLFREDYARAGMLMLPVVDVDGRMTARTAILFAAALVPVSLAPAVVGSAGTVYLVGVAVLGLWFLARAVCFARSRTMDDARALLRASLVHLPGAFALLTAERLFVTWN